MPERTERVERQVAELREDVRRIEHRVSSLQVEPEAETLVPSPKVEAKVGKGPPKGPPKGKGKGPKGPPKGPPKGVSKGAAPKVASKGKAAPSLEGKGAGNGKGASPVKEGAAPFHKRLYWKQVDLADAEGTIFSERSTRGSIDFQALSKILEAEKTKGSQLQRRSSGVLSKVQMRNVGTKVLSDHRARNIAIILKRMPCSTEELAEVLRLLQWEDGRMSSDDLEQIGQAIPTVEESRRLSEQLPGEVLRDVEQMVLPLTLPRGAARVRVLCIARSARGQFKQVTNSLARVRAACKAIESSAMLRNVMVLALELGNFINHGDAKKGAKERREMEVSRVPTYMYTNNIHEIELIYHIARLYIIYNIDIYDMLIDDQIEDISPKTQIRMQCLHMVRPSRSARSSRCATSRWPRISPRCTSSAPP